MATLPVSSATKCTITCAKARYEARVSSDIRAILHAPNRAEAERFLQLTIKKYQEKSKGFAEWMENNIPESLTVMDFPEAHRRRLRTSNLAERVNKEVRRRTRVASIFPNTESCLRLVTAVIMEIDEEWIEGQVYLNFENKTEWNG